MTQIVEATIVSGADKLSVSPSGNPIDNVSVVMDYTIIEHFSNHLYKSPNKAIEELVVNGYDAFATWVKVYLKGRYCTNYILIWDNGNSMDKEGLKGLWNVAKSPKRDLENDRTITLKGTTRKIIGKFGIGKVASYTLGKRIAHLCKINEIFLWVEIDYDKLTNTLEKQQDQESPKGFSTPIVQLSEKDAKDFVKSCFNELPNDFEASWGEESWTLAIVSELKPVRNITEKRLRWVMGHAMPIRPDFSVTVDQNKVESKLIREGAEFDLDFGDSDVQSFIKTRWESLLDKNEAVKPISFGKILGLDPKRPTQEVPYLENELLGKIRGRFLLFKNPIQNSKSDEDEPRTHGFFVIVRDRLLNLDDPKILFDREPNFGVFFRSQMILYVDALDSALLADRERVMEDKPVANELSELLRIIYYLMLKKMGEMFKDDQEGQKESNRLPTYSSEFFLRPLAELLGQHNEEINDIKIHEISILTKPLLETDHLAIWSKAEKAFIINESHPFHKTVRQLAGTSTNKKLKSLLYQYDILAAYESLFEGQLWHMGLSSEQITTIINWRDSMYRVLADHSRDEVTQLIRELNDASFQRDAIFEKAVIKVLNRMGFTANHVGKKGKADGNVLAGAGNVTFKMSIETKALENSDKKLGNGEADVAGAARHRDDENIDADFAVILAREFSGDFKAIKGDDNYPAILGECESVGRVSIMTVEALGKLLIIVDRYKYPLNELREVFEVIEPPMEKLARINALDKPLEGFDFSELLERIRQEQETIGLGDSISWKPIYQKFYKDKRSKFRLEEDDFDRKIHAIAALLPLHVKINYESKEIALLQSAENLAEEISKTLDRFAQGT